MQSSGWRSALAILISPPFGYILGLIAAIVLWFALADVELPQWARLAISLMAVTAVPGLWFLILPIWLMIPQVIRMEEPAGHAEWMKQHARVWGAHHETLGAMVAAPIRSVHAFGTSQESSGVRMTLLALDLTDLGGCFSIQYAMLGEPQPMDEPPGDLSATVEDDHGTTYAVATRSLDTAPNGGRCSVYFLPAPAARTARLRLTIDRLFIIGRGAAIEGPWTFDVALPSSGP